MPKYIAKQSIGHFMPGEEIKGLDDKQLQALLVSGAIEEYQAPEAPKEDGTAARLAELEKVNTELKTQVAELEKALTASEAALKKLTADTKKAGATKE